MRGPVWVRPSTNRPDAFFKIEDKPVGRVAVEIVSVEPLAAEETQTLVQFHRGRVGGFGFEDDLARNIAR